LLLPTKNRLSGPLALRSSSILALISFSAWSQVMRWYLVPTSFIGYLRRYSPWPFSRTAAPLAQCAPRLMGLSNTGSWRTHTPFSTTASMAQPTEQCPQTVRLTFNLAGAERGGRLVGGFHLFHQRQLRCGDAGSHPHARAAQEGPPVHRGDCALHAAREIGDEA
jgi:hypothetical protein